MGTQLPSPKRGQSPPIFGPCLLCPNGWMDQDATRYGGRPRPRRHCVRWGSSSPSPKGGTVPPNFWPILWSNDWWIKMALGTKVGLGPGRIVLHGDPAPCCVTWRPSSPFQKGHSLPIFGPCLLWPNARPSHLLLSTCKLYNVATFVTLVSLMSVTALCCYTTRGYII